MPKKVKQPTTSATKQTPFFIKRKKLLLYIAGSILCFGLIGYITLFRSPFNAIPLAAEKKLIITGNIERARSLLTHENKTIMAELPCMTEECSDTVSVALDGDQITELVAQFKPRWVLIQDMRFVFEGNVARAIGTNMYPLFPGVISVEAMNEDNRFTLKRAYLGQIPIPESQYSTIEDYGNYLIFSVLSKYSIYAESMEITDGKIHATLHVPKGMVTVDPDGKVIIDVDKIPGNIDQPPTGSDIHIN